MVSLPPQPAQSVATPVLRIAKGLAAGIALLGACVSFAGCSGETTVLDHLDASTRRDGGTSNRDAGSAALDAGGARDAGGRDSGSTDSGSGGQDSGYPGDCSAGPLALPRPGCAPPVPPSSGDPALDCVNRINQLRWECQCLPPLNRWTSGEACAAEEAEYDVTNGPHAGFAAGLCEDGYGQNECPNWGSIDSTIDRCLQNMWDEGPGEPFRDHGHYLNMTNSRFTEVACGFYTRPNGLVWAVHNFR